MICTDIIINTKYLIIFYDKIINQFTIFLWALKRNRAINDSCSKSFVVLALTAGFKMIIISDNYNDKYGDNYGDK